MKSDLPKVLHKVAGVPMIKHVLNACYELTPDQIIVVTAPGATKIEETVSPHQCVVQQTPMGTGDAVKAARKALIDFAGDVIVLFADGPLITAKSLRALQRRRQETNAAIVVAGFSPENPAQYGRLVIDETGNLSAIVEASEATPEQNALRLCNGGVMLFDIAKLWPLLDKLTPDNAKGEYFLTDCIALAQQEGDTSVVEIIPAEDVLGVNNRVELAAAEKIMQRRLREKAMLNGVTMIDPDSVFLSADTRFGRDVVLGPGVVIGEEVTIGDNVEIRAYSHIEQASIDAGASVGPFARLRPGTEIGAAAHVGSFVEIKNTEVGEGAKVPHLSYIGDTTIGAKTNIGAGTITCNYNGYKKMRTEIGAGAFIGSNSSLVAPVKIGDGAYVGAGSVITMDVPADGLAVARGRQDVKPGWAHRFREDQEK
jgi:bifunctional UDP-N-acetylglucosamine pyrophosphorylase/glucosamine-1-phosphate N-acetyltransferase